MVWLKSDSCAVLWAAETRRAHFSVYPARNEAQTAGRGARPDPARPGPARSDRDTTDAAAALFARWLGLHSGNAAVTWTPPRTGGTTTQSTAGPRSSSSRQNDDERRWRGVTESNIRPFETRYRRITNEMMYFKDRHRPTDPSKYKLYLTASDGFQLFWNLNFKSTCCIRIALHSIHFHEDKLMFVV